jgi:enediyne biosynthesis protein E4
MTRDCRSVVHRESALEPGLSAYLMKSCCKESAARSGLVEKGRSLLLLALVFATTIEFTPRGIALQAALATNGKAPQSAPAGKANGVSATPVESDGRISFEDLIDRSGIKFQLNNSISPQRYSIETMLGGVAVFDYNNDGLLDIFFTNGAAIPSLEKSGPDFWNRLYRNNGDGTFTDVTEHAGVKGIGYSMGVAAGDFDNDGFVDLYVVGVNHNQLLHNNGDGTFTDVTEKAGVAGTIPAKGKPWAVAAGWFDYNNDGLLDLLVINYLDYDIADCKLCSIDGVRTYCAPGNFKGTANILYRNNGDGTFTDVSAASHIGQYIGKGMGLAFADYDNDGSTDVFVSNDTFPNFLLHNNGDGTFKDVALEQGVAYTANGNVVAGMGADFRDLNNDGLPDIFHTAMFGNTFPLYKNSGTQFDDVTEVSGMTAFSHRLTAWGTGAFDFDNDGYKDLFTAGGAILDNELEVLHRPTLLPNGLLRNNGNFAFTDVSSTAGAAFVAPKSHRGAAFGDFNNDGKIDIVVTALNDKPQLLMNTTSNGNHWILLKLVGTKDNRDGLGTRVKITTSEGFQFNQATTAVGYSSSSDKRVHFGLGKASVVDKIELWWPTGLKQVLTQVKADQVLTIVESK